MKVVNCFFLMGVLLLSACNAERNLEYVNARNGKILVVNTPLHSKQLDKGFIISSVGKQSAPSLEPPVVN